MIRRWSCINKFNFNPNCLVKFDQKFKINLFLSLINLKKFFFLFTKFKRKSLSRIKHKTTWLIYTNIFKLWIKDYFFMRKYIKIQSLYNIFFYNIFFYNTNFIKNKTSTNLSNNFNFIYSFFSKKIFNYYNYNSNIFKNVNILYGFNRTPSFLSNSVIPVCFQFSNEFFFLKNLDLNFFISDQFILDLILTKVREIYKVLIILNYYHISLKNF